MSPLRLTILGLVCVGATTAVLIACVGDDATVVQTAPTDDAGTSTDATTPVIAIDASHVDPVNPVTTDDASTASQACTDYCNTFDLTCRFQASSSESYPSLAVCLAICANTPATGVDVDSTACRVANFADAGSGACIVAGPWGVDPDTQTYCAATGSAGGTGERQPCNSICRANTEKCGGSTADCLDFCEGLSLSMAGTAAVTCAKQKTLDAYTAASPTDVTSACTAFKACDQ